MRMIIIIFVAFYFFSCERTEPLPPINPEPIDTTYLLQWESKIGNHDYSINYGFIHNNEYIIGAKDLDSVSSSRLIGFDKFNGNKLWEYEFSKERGGWRGFARILKQDNLIIISTITALYCFDLNKRTISWSVVYEDIGKDGWPYISIIDDYVYNEVSTGIYATNGFQNNLIRINIHTGKIEYIYQYNHPKNWSVSHSQPAQYIDKNSGDTILLFKRYYSSPSEGPKMPSDLVAYNLTRKEVMWEKIAFSPLSSSEFYASNIVDDDALVVSDNSVYKYDIMTGELLWKRTLGSNPNAWLGYFLTAQPTMYDGKLFLQENGKGFYCIDVNDGNVIWANSNGSSSPGYNMVINKDMIVNNCGGCGRIRGYDLHTGMSFMSQKAPNGNVPGNGVEYDIETDSYFTQDFHSVFSFKVNKPK